MIHREGYKTLTGIMGFLLLINLILWASYPHGPVKWISFSISLAIFAFVAWFFRQPSRPAPFADQLVIAPADGTVLNIDELFVGEFFQDYRIRVSIFMSGGNVHINWIPLSGFVRYLRYNPGRHLFAKHPKSSDQNERSTLVIESSNGKQLMVRQIAGVMARRVITYPQSGAEVNTGGELGFIKFGSRVDLFFPKGTEILVKQGEKTKGNFTPIAVWK
jgi:phosphatidylserine decarboxylase